MRSERSLPMVRLHVAARSAVVILRRWPSRSSSRWTRCSTSESFCLAAILVACGVVWVMRGNSEAEEHARSEDA
eukprot:6951644-Prymnesium_polylepis.1